MSKALGKRPGNDSLTLTYSTRLRIDNVEDRRYLDNRFEYYAHIEHELFNGLAHGKLESKGLRDRTAHKYGISGRQANSLVHKTLGRLASLKALKKLEKSALTQRIWSIEAKIQSLSDKISVLKQDASENIITDKQLHKLRALKAKKHRLSLKLNQLRQRLAEFDKRANSLCFGTKRLFKAQFHLEDSGFASHGDWLREWRKARANSWYFLGASAEHLGNQNCQYDINKESLFVRMDTVKLKHIVINGVKFPHGADEIRAAQQNGQPVTCKIQKTERKYYLRASVALPKPMAVTYEAHGSIGLDYNKGFIQACDVSGDGNITGFMKYHLPDSGKNKAMGETALRTAVKAIAEKAAQTGRPVIIENLDFTKKKALSNKHVSKRKKYNSMINSFDYSRYIEYLESACYKAGVRLSKVNPYKTSKTGSERYAKRKGINTHQAASYAIGRLGLGFHI